MSNPNLNQGPVTGGSGITINGLSSGNIAILTTATTLLTVGAAHLNRLKSINFLNNDTVPHSITWQVVKSGGSTVVLGGGGVPLSLAPGVPLLIQYGGVNFQDGDVVQALADVANKIHALLSFDDLY